MQWDRKKPEARRQKTSDWAVQTLREQVMVVAMGRKKEERDGRRVVKAQTLGQLYVG